jgi:hypothetical protein
MCICYGPLVARNWVAASSPYSGLAGLTRQELPSKLLDEGNR